MRWIVGVVAAGLGLVAVGLWIVATEEVTRDFGWFAYTPLEAPGPTGSWFVTTRLLAGAVIAVLGLLAVTATLAFAAGRRTGRRAP